MSLLGAIKTCLVSTLRWLRIASTSSRMLSWSNNNNDGSNLKSWRQLKSRFRNSSNVASFERNSIQTWLLTLYPSLKKNGKIRVYIDFRDFNIACPKDEFPLPITDVMIDNTCDFERVSFMDDFLGTTKSRCIQMMKSIHNSEHRWVSFATRLCRLA